MIRRSCVQGLVVGLIGLVCCGLLGCETDDRLEALYLADEDPFRTHIRRIIWDPERDVGQIAETVEIARFPQPLPARAYQRHIGPQLRLGAERLAAGRLRTEVPVQGAAEVARLAATFNEMAAQLRADRASLQQRAARQHRHWLQGVGQAEQFFTS